MFDFDGILLFTVFLIDLLSFDLLDRFERFDEYETRLDFNSLTLD